MSKNKKAAKSQKEAPKKSRPKREPIHYGKELARIRHRFEISQAVLAERMGYNACYLCQRENSPDIPGAEFMRKFAEAFNIPFEAVYVELIPIPDDLVEDDKQIIRQARKVLRDYYTPKKALKVLRTVVAV